MKTIGSTFLAALLLLQFSSAPLYGQQNDSNAGKKVTIVKRSTEPDGTETTETIVKKGKAADNFDVDQFLKENKSDNVRVDIHVEDGDTERSITTGKNSTNGLNFLHLYATDKGAFLGVEEDSDEKSGEAGLTVSVVKGSAAAKAGLKNNDVVLKLDGTPINSWKDLTAFIRKAKPGDKVRITYTHKGKEKTAEATLTTHQEVQDRAEEKHGFLGINQLSDDRDKPGVAVEIVGKSAAEKAGLKSGDIILKMNDAEIDNWEDITDFMADTKPGDKVSITYERNGQSNKIEATLGEEKSWDWGSWNNLGQDIQNLAFSVTKKEACLGVYTEATSSGSAEGALISDFTEESAAKEINLTKGDIITSVNGALVKGHDDLWKEIAKFKAGDKVKIDYIRNGVKNTVEATLKGCRDHENQIIINDTDETGDNQSRKFFLWNWGTNEEKQIREKRIIPIHKGEGDSPINNADQNTVATTDRNLQLKSFTAFPNPTMGQVTVEFKAEPVATVVSLFDQSGRQLFREELNAFSGDYSQQFDLSEHTKGTIRIQVEQKQKVFSEQIVVN